MHNMELIKASYEGARSEILVRLRIRSQTFAFYLAATGIILGYIIKENSPAELVFFMSILSLAVCLMVTHHNICIALASSFCGTKLKKGFGEVAMWNNCAVSDSDAKKRRFLRSLSQMLIIILPPLLAIALKVFKQDSSNWLSKLCMWQIYGSITIVIVVLMIMWWSKIYRQRMYNLSSEDDYESV